MPFGQLVIGPPGAGKTTYCYGLQQFLTALERPICLVNLDPAASNPPYQADIDINDLITLQDAMDEFQLGPNGGMLYCLEYLEHNLDWLETKLQTHGKDYVVFDLPGQVELSTDHQSLRRIVERLEKLDYRLCAVHLTDAHHITDASKFVAVLLLALRTMLQMELPHVNVLSKIDLLAFNLDFYTEVQDLHFLNDLLDEEAQRTPRGAKFSQLNKAICDVVEDFGLVGFETLCVEDKESMAMLVKSIDGALGYQPQHAEDEEQLEGFDMTQFIRSVDISSNGPSWSKSSQAQHVQERWMDERAMFDEAETDNWQKEAQFVRHKERHRAGEDRSSSGKSRSTPANAV